MVSVLHLALLHFRLYSLAEDGSVLEHFLKLFLADDPLFGDAEAPAQDGLNPGQALARPFLGKFGRRLQRKEGVVFISYM